jgi:hypothetical protein
MLQPEMETGADLPRLTSPAVCHFLEQKRVIPQHHVCVLLFIVVSATAVSPSGIFRLADSKHSQSYIAGHNSIFTFFCPHSAFNFYVITQCSQQNQIASS